MITCCHSVFCIVHKADKNKNFQQYVSLTQHISAHNSWKWKVPKNNWFSTCMYILVTASRPGYPRNTSYHSMCNVTIHIHIHEITLFSIEMNWTMAYAKLLTCRRLQASLWEMPQAINFGFTTLCHMNGSSAFNLPSLYHCQGENKLSSECGCHS